jgi:hypothetical protein
MKAERPRASTRVEMQVSKFRSKKEDQHEHGQETRSQFKRWAGRGVQRQSGGMFWGVTWNVGLSRVAESISRVVPAGPIHAHLESGMDKRTHAGYID